MYTGTSHQCMFQPQDQIEVGEDGFKQYDGKPGFYERVCEYVCFILLSVCSCGNVIICILHAVPLNLNAKHVYLLPPIFYFFFLLSTLLPPVLRFSHHGFGHGRHDEYDLRMVGEPSEV